MVYKVLLLVYFLDGVSSRSVNPLQDPLLQARVGVAQCRASCLQEDPTCSSTSCLACWQTCYKDESELGRICEDESCGEGCRTACNFYSGLNSIPAGRRTGRSRSLEFSSSPTLSSCGELSWGAPSFSANSFRVSSERSINSPVFLVLGRDRSGRWYEINQTETLNTRIQVQTLAKLQEIVIAGVERSGVMLNTKIRVEEQVLEPCSTSSNPGEVKDESALSPNFKLQLDGIVSQGPLVKVGLTWNQDFKVPSEFSGSRFLVEWNQVPEGFIRGSLYTNSSSVSLALLSSTLISVQVQDLAANLRSAPISVSTYSEKSNLDLNLALVLSIISILLSFLALLLILLRIYSKTPDNKTQTKPSNNNSIHPSSIVILPPSSPLPPYSSSSLQNVFSFQSPKLKEVNIVNDKLSTINDFINQNEKF